jgi:uncharacterized RDD family membrane protein YckC
LPLAVRIPAVCFGKPSAAQNGTVIQTCKKCGAINQVSADRCCFCEESLGEGAAVGVSAAAAGASSSRTSPLTAPGPESSWREEISSKLRSYRARRRGAILEKMSHQSALPFATANEPGITGVSEVQTAIVEEEMDDPLQTALASAAARVAEVQSPPVIEESEVAAPAAKPAGHEPKLFEHLVIDVSRPPGPDLVSILRSAPEPSTNLSHPSQAVPVADLAARRRAFLVDASCLLVAFTCVLGLYMGFGGKLLATKLDVLVCAAALTLLYTQYFTLFTVMGGATPGMMFAGLRVLSFEGQSPEPVRLLWRSFGYFVSGVTALLGFCWALADEDRLTWHDRISQTYLAHAYALGERPAAPAPATQGD